jgi:DNA-binding PadR family transcriptional regulator
MSRTARPPEDLLPLTPAAFEILLALADGDAHGYQIMRAVDARTGGQLTLQAGTLYRALARLLGEGLIAELDERPDPDQDDVRRRYYRLTPFGVRVTAAEVERLSSQVKAARSRRLLRRTGG